MTEAELTALVDRNEAGLNRLLDAVLATQQQEEQESERWDGLS